MLLSCTIEPPARAKQMIESETRELFDKHPEYVWFDPQFYHIPLFLWRDGADDLVDKLTQKVTDLVFDLAPFTLYGSEYVVRIGTRIDINLDFQPDKTFCAIADRLTSFFQPDAEALSTPVLPLARYKVPSKQQYTHVKNKLAQLTTAVEFPVSELVISHMTDYGKGAKEYKPLARIALAA